MNEPYRLLIAAVPSTLAAALDGEFRRLGRELVCACVESADALAAALDRGPWDMVLAFHPAACLPVAEILNLLRRRSLDIPALIVSPAPPDEAALTAIRMGARDFVSTENPGILAAVTERELLLARERQLHPGDPSWRATFQETVIPMWVIDVETLRFVEVNAAAVAQYGYSREEFLSMTITEIVPPQDAPLVAGAARHPDRGSHCAGIWRSLKKDGSLIDVEIVVEPVVFAGRRAQMVLASDVTERLRIEAGMEERNRLAALIAETAAALGRAGTLGSGLQECVERLVHHLDAAFARIWTVNAAESVLELEASAGMYTHIDGAHGRVPLGSFKIGRIGQEGKPHLTNSVQDDAWVGDPEWARREQMVAFAGYPLIVEGRVLGVVGAFARHALTEAAIQTMASLADAIAQFIRRKRAEEALRDSEERVRLLLDSTGEAIYGIDLQGRCTFANRACLRLLGFAHAEDMAGKNAHSLIHHSQADGSPNPLEECAINRAFERGEGTHADGEVFWHADGTCFPAEYWSYPVLKEGEVVGAVVTFGDLTERKRAREEQFKLISLIESTDDFIALASPEGRITYLNQGACRLIGLEDAQAALGLPMLALHPESRWAQLRGSISTAMRTGSYRTETQLRHFRTGEPIDVLLNGLVVRQPDSGEVLSFAAIMHDITQRKQNEQALLVAKQSAETATRLKSEFLANMSHEIRTPMNGVIGMAGLLLDTELTPEQRHYAEIVRSSGESLLALINDILDFSKIEAHKLELEVVDFDLRSILEDAVHLLSAAARKKGIGLGHAIAPEVPLQLRGDSGRLRQILLNLGGNAVKFTPAGRVSIETRLDREDKRSAAIRFSVKDTGIGIAADRQHEIFSPFTQGDGSTTRKYGGTGLGLAISRQLAELLGGEIGVRSEPGHGSTFWFTAVLEKRPGKVRADFRSPRAQAVDQGRAGRRGSRMSRRTGRILLAEDNITNQQVALAILEKLGCRADAVANGKEALTSLRRIPYDLVLMDCQMPEMNGYEASAAIRDPQSGVINPQIPIVALTAHAMKGDREKCLAAGMNDYVVKPVDRATLAAALDQWLRGDTDSSPAGAVPDGAARTEGPRATSPAVFDEGALVERLMGDRTLARTIVRGFLDDMPKQLAALRSHLSGGDTAAVQRQAHSIKGAAATVGGNTLRQAALEMEEAARTGDTGGMAARLDEVERQFQAVQKAIESTNGGEPVRPER